MADPATYRTRDEVEQQKRNDPLRVLLERMRAAGAEASREELDGVESDVAREIEGAIRFAEESPDPDPESIWDDVYASRDDPAIHRDV